MPPLADIIVFTPSMYPVLAVNVAGAQPASAEEAAADRQYWHERGMLMDCPFLLLVYPTSLFLWRRETPVADLPDYVAAAKSVLSFRNVDTPGADDLPWSKGAMLLLVSNWLFMLVNDLRDPDPECEPEKMLLDSGIYEQIRWGNVDDKDP